MLAPTTHAQATDRFIFRPATLDDLPQAVAMFNRCSQEQIGQDEFSVETYRNEWSDPTIDLATDTRVAQTPEGRIVGCIEVWNSAPYVFSWVWGRVDPEYRGQGLGTALMEWAEERARSAIARAPAGTRVFMQTATISTHQPTIDLMLDQGLRPVRFSWTMARDLDEPPPAATWPEGVTVRTFIPGQDEEAVYRTVNGAFKDHWGHVETPFAEGLAMWEHRMLNNPEFDPSLWFLAVDGDQIAGAALCARRTDEDPDMGWVNTLGVLRPWRRQGLGLALLYHSFGELYSRGQRKVGLGVDAGSLTGATRLYEKAGMRAIRQFETYQKDLRSGLDLSTQSVAD
jgi:mycothiol synthase